MSLPVLGPLLDLSRRCPTALRPLDLHGRLLVRAGSPEPALAVGIAMTPGVCILEPGHPAPCRIRWRQRESMLVWERDGA